MQPFRTLYAFWKRRVYVKATNFSTVFFPIMTKNSILWAKFYLPNIEVACFTYNFTKLKVTQEKFIKYLKLNRKLKLKIDSMNYGY